MDKHLVTLVADATGSTVVAEAAIEAVQAAGYKIIWAPTTQQIADRFLGLGYSPEAVEGVINSHEGEPLTDMLVRTMEVALVALEGMK